MPLRPMTWADAPKTYTPGRQAKVMTQTDLEVALAEDGESENLNIVQRQFVNEYLLDLDPGAAAKRMGRTSHWGFALFKEPEVISAIAQAMEARGERTRITGDNVLKGLANVAFADPRKLMSWGPGGLVLKDSGSLEADDVSFISGISVTPGRYGDSIKMTFNDRMGALRDLGRHHGLFVDRKEVSITHLDSLSPDELDALAAAIAGSSATLIEGSADQTEPARGSEIQAVSAAEEVP